MERMGISAWSTGGGTVCVHQKADIVLFYLHVFGNDTDHVIFDQPYEFRRTACLICHKEKLQPEFGRIFGTSGLHVVSPLLCPLQHPGQPYKKASGLAGGFDGDILP